MWIFMERYKDSRDLIGPFLRYLRKDMDFTQKEVSDETGFSIQTVSKLENGKSNPRSYAGKMIADFLITNYELRGHNAEEQFVDFCSIYNSIFEIEQ